MSEYGGKHIGLIFLLIGFGLAGVNLYLFYQGWINFGLIFASIVMIVVGIIMSISTLIWLIKGKPNVKRKAKTITKKELLKAGEIGNFWAFTGRYAALGIIVGIVLLFTGYFIPGLFLVIIGIGYIALRLHGIKYKYHKKKR